MTVTHDQKFCTRNLRQILMQVLCTEYSCILYSQQETYEGKHLHKKARQTCNFLVQVSWAYVKKGIRTVLISELTRKPS